jgi:hypothetical protein
MFTRRFVLVTVVLVTLNAVLWFASPGFALRKAVIQQLFGQKMTRAVVIMKNGSEWHLDRGVITQVTATQLTIKESDTRVQVIPISASTKVFRLGRLLPLLELAPRWHVLVTWPDSGAAVSVDVERIPPNHGRGRARPSGPASSLS